MIAREVRGQGNHHAKEDSLPVPRLHLRPITPGRGSRPHTVGSLSDRRSPPSGPCPDVSALPYAGESITQIATALVVEHRTVRLWIRRFNVDGLTGLEDAGRPGRPTTFDAEAVATAMRSPETLDQPFATWSLDRLMTYLHEEKAITIHRTPWQNSFMPWDYGGDPRRHGSANAWTRRSPKKGSVVCLYTARPPQSLVLCLDEMGPESARSFPGWTLVDIAEHLGARAHKEADYGRRGHGYVFGAFCPATG